MDERTYTCADCGITRPCPRPTGMKPKRCPEHSPRFKHPIQCLDCGVEVARNPGKGQNPRRCPEHRAQAAQEALQAGREAWRDRRAAQGLPREDPRPPATSEQLAERRRRWRERNPSPPPRQYTCADCGCIGLHPAKGPQPKRCPEHAEVARKKRDLECARQWARENRERSRDSHRRWRARNPAAQRRAIKDWSIRNPDRILHYRYQRRLQESVTAIEYIDRQAVFARDGWVCSLCSEPVDPALRFPDPGSVSLDHIRPISRGGTHTYDNVQCSHLVCNQRKSHTWEDPV